ncbi:MAG: nucleoside hydrolase [Candidatus Omnitrophica bacterium]|nr:nucleoside hydrolase [Candidatus Omnitrophota bacterium]
MRQVIVDCDPGVDDALAVYALLGSSDVRVRAVTTIFGNVPVRQATRNVARILGLLPPSMRPPVAEGAEQPLTGSRLPRRTVHGRDGLGEVAIPLRVAQPSAGAGSLLMKRVLEANGIDAVVGLGPLTNIARLFAAAPRALQRLPMIAVMGGTISEAATATEFNLASDPAAGRCLLGGRLPLRWIPLEMAASVMISAQAVEEFRAAHRASPLAEVIAKLLSFAIRARGGGHQAAIPDAVAAALALDPSLGRWQARRLVLEGRARTGRLRVEGGLPNASVCAGVDAPRLAQRLWTLWSTLVKRVDDSHAVDS